MKNFIYILLGLTIFSCSNESKQIADSKALGINFKLPDNLFAFKDITNSHILDKFLFDKRNKNTHFSDSILKTALTVLDTIQKRRLLAPVIVSDMKVPDSNYPVNFMNAYFVSKQKMIGYLTPIVIYAEGDDFFALYYILLDSNYNPVSHFRMFGGNQGGPIMNTDSTLTLPTVRHTYLNGNLFTFYTLNETIKPDSVKHSLSFDSVNYSGTILPSGQIVVKREDSTRYRRASTW